MAFKNLDQANKYQREWYARNKEKINAKSRDRWAARHSDAKVHVKLWTEEEILLLYQLNMILSEEEIAVKLGRTRSATAMQMWRLGIPTLRASHRRQCNFDTTFWTDADKGYLAAFIDGEGTISMFGPKKGHLGRRINPLVFIGNTNEGVMVYLSGLLNAGLTRKHLKSGKTFFTLRLYSIADCRCLLRTLLPFLRVKKAQAVIVLDAIENHRVGGAFNRDALARIAYLNVKGVERCEFTS